MSVMGVFLSLFFISYYVTGSTIIHEGIYVNYIYFFLDKQGKLLKRGKLQAQSV